MFSVVDLLNVFEIYPTVSVSVQLFISFTDKLLPGLVHLSNHSSQKLIIADASILVDVK